MSKEPLTDFPNEDDSPTEHEQVMSMLMAVRADLRRIKIEMGMIVPHPVTRGGDTR